jgi:hypothetical protein
MTLPPGCIAGQLVSTSARYCLSNLIQSVMHYINLRLIISIVNANRRESQCRPESDRFGEMV